MSGVYPRFKVVLTDPAWSDTKYEEDQLGSIADLHLLNCRSEDQLVLNCADADALLVTYAPISRKVIGKLHKCRIISVFGIGVDMVDLGAATEAGIYVTNVPGYCTEEVADHAMALLLSAARRTVFFHQTLKEDGQWNWRAGKPMHRLRGKILGLVGFGRIPKAVAARAKSFGLKIMVFDPYVAAEECDQAGVLKSELETLLQAADFVSIHAPLTPQTRGLINANRLRMMKRTAVIINASRGPVIEEASLIQALEEGRIAGAALDVLETEPPENMRLLKMTNVILTPHVGFYSEEAVEELRSRAAIEVKRVLNGQQPQHLVNAEVLNRARKETPLSSTRAGGRDR